ncbi:hypothetical protein MKW92_043280 [Papaver armeniacum]|nr:hypothetical protein MKW92_043280 [Papaver armeniacum]
MMNDEEMEEMEFSMNNEELEEMEFSMNKEKMEEMEFSMNNEEMEETDSNPCFPETITKTLEETTHARESGVPTRNKKISQMNNRVTMEECKRLGSNGSATIFDVESIVKRIWKRGKDCNSKDLPFDVSSRKPTRVGPKPRKVDLSKIMEIPLRQRTSIRSIAKLNMPKSMYIDKSRKEH